MTNKNYNYNYNKYSEKRKKDIKVEKACASFVDKYWYSKYQLEYKRIADTAPLTNWVKMSKSESETPCSR